MTGGAGNSTVMRGASFLQVGSHFHRKNCMGVPQCHRVCHSVTVERLKSENILNYSYNKILYAAVD